MNNLSIPTQTRFGSALQGLKETLPQWLFFILAFMLVGLRIAIGLTQFAWWLFGISILAAWVTGNLPTYFAWILTKI